MSILGCSEQEILDLVEKGVKLFSSLPGQEKENCGFFVVCDSHRYPDVVPHLVREIGVCHPEKWQKYFDYAREKGTRLAGNFNHVSSWQSRNPDNSQWGGAIVVSPSTIFSFSGLPELGDEAVMLFVGVQLRRLGLDVAKRIAAVSNNQFFCQLMEAYRAERARAKSEREMP